MIIIGEKINTTLKAIRPAVENYDTEAIQEIAKAQVEAGADYLDVNCGTFVKDETKRMEWLVNTIQEVVDTPLVIDSPNPKAIEVGLKNNKNGKPIINSITDEKERFEQIAPLVVEYDTGIIALCMDDNGMPEDTDQRVKIAGSMIEKLTAKGVKLGDIYIDPLVRPISTGDHLGLVALNTIRKVMEEYPGVHTTCGLSNISYGIPGRRALNQAFLISAMNAGLDSAILDPLDKRIMTFIYATEALLQKDSYCMNYITAYREGKLEA